MKTRIFFSALALFGMVMVASAQTPAPVTTPVSQNSNSERPSCFVDANNNGMCDLRESGECPGNPVRQGLRRGPRNGQGFSQGNGQGIGPRNGQGIGRTEGGRGLGPCGRGQGPAK